MQLTITLNNLLFFLFCMGIAAIVIYAVVLGRTFAKSLAEVMSAITGYRRRLDNLAEQWENVAADIHDMNDDIRNKSHASWSRAERHGRSLADSIAEFQAALATVKKRRPGGRRS